MSDTVIFYPGMLRAYSECPLKYKLKYLDNIVIVQNQSYSQTGRKIHALANFYLKGQDVTKLENALNEEERNLFNQLKSNPLFNKIYINSEYNLTANLAGYWISGRLDALVKDVGGYYILDYKTGALPKNPQYDFQTVFYLTILNIYLKGVRPEEIHFVYMDLKNNKNVEISLNENLAKEYSQILKTSCDTISEDKQFVPNTKSCKFCEYVKFCPKCED